MEVQWLADQPGLIGTLAAWFHAKWGSNPEHPPDSIAARLSQRLNRDELPLALVGFVEGNPVASASLKIRELDSCPEYDHWLGSVYVTPSQRGKGFGKLISRAAADQAESLGLRKLYLYTNLDLVAFYQSLGWVPIKEVERNGRPISVMRRILGAA